VPGIHILLVATAWMAGIWREDALALCPAMTKSGIHES
jgi:hypothetical protein